MRAHRSGRLRAHVISLLALTLVAGCGGENTTGPGGGTATGPAGDLAQVLGDAAQQLLVTNKGSFESLEFFAPFVAGLTTAAPPAGAARSLAALQGSCPPGSVLGTTYDFNFSQNGYTATGQSGAPSNGTRFLLYGLNASGAPQSGSPLGYVDLTCSAEPRANPAIVDIAFTLQLVANDVTVLTMNMSGSVNIQLSSLSLSGQGSLTSADGTQSLSYEGGSSGDVGSGTGGFTFNLPQSITASFGRNNQSDGTFFVSVNVRRQVGQDFWSFDLLANGDASERISGPLNFSDTDVGSGVFACVDGPFPAPEVTAAGNCAATGEFQIPDVGPDELEAVGTGYMALEQIWAALNEFLQTGADVVIAASAG